MTVPSSAAVTVHPYAVRRIGATNWRGVWTLYLREVRRFVKVLLQTVLAPAVTSMLFLLIFTVAIGGSGRISLPISFGTFLVPGLVMMTILQNAFANTSSSILIGKVHGSIIDVLMPPLSAGELTFSYTMGGVTRGVLCAVAVLVPAAFFVPVGVSHLWAILYFGLSGAVMMALFGEMTAIWADKFDHSAAINNFVIIPLSFLSGTFYSIERLPPTAQLISHFNPFFYLIDGFRYGFIGYADSHLGLGVAVTLAVNAALWAACYLMFRSGYKLKA
jgi:ABC-2 type transport system permease protein